MKFFSWFIPLENTLLALLDNFVSNGVKLAARLIHILRTRGLMPPVSFLTGFIALFFVSFHLLAQSIPEELEAAGFDHHSLVNYNIEDNLQYFTFLDWQTDELWDVVVFVVDAGEIVDWFKE